MTDPTPLPSPEELSNQATLGGVDPGRDPFKDNPQLEEILSDRIDMHDAYYSTFHEGISGKKVLKHLKKIYGFKGDAIYQWGTTEADVAFKLGQRYVIENMMRFMDTAPDEFKRQILAEEERQRNPQGGF